MQNCPFSSQKLVTTYFRCEFLTHFVVIDHSSPSFFSVSPTAVTALAMIGKLGSTMGLNGMYIYSSEIFPTEVRAAGLGASSMCARIAGLVGPYVGGLLVSSKIMSFPCCFIPNFYICCQ